MKLQFGNDRVRLRVSHAELALLRGGGTASAGVAWPGAPWRIDVRVGDGLSMHLADAVVRLVLPRNDVDDLAARLPSRDGLQFRLELPSGPLDLHFEVDVRDGRTRAR